MAEHTNKKKIISKLIAQVLEDEENLNTFVFFLNRLENIRRPTDEIKQILKDYLCICENEPAKGKKRVKHIADRHVLHCKENVGFIDVNKIEIIANAVLNKTDIKLSITIHDFKRRYKKNILKNDVWGEKYRDLVGNFQEGDEIFEFISARWTWKQLCGRTFVALVRNGTAVTAIIKSMN